MSTPEEIDTTKVYDGKVSNESHRYLVRPAKDGELKCDECGSKMVCPTCCGMCHGEDETGEHFCPKCNYCCGC